MTLDQAKNLLGASHVEWCMLRGAAYCAKRALDQIAFGKQALADAYRAVERAVNELAARRPA